MTFQTLGLKKGPVTFLAPLAGVSDHPFRRMNWDEGADLCYVEMISASALLYESKGTYDRLKRHDSEPRLGVQLTGKTEEDIRRGVEILGKMNFDTIDLNMGCPVKKVVQAGCGSAILKDPDLVYRMTRAACGATDKPLSVKIRLGWDHGTKNYLEVGEAAQKGGAAWITLHGRTRSDTYADPVHGEAIKKLKQSLGIPVIGNGNLFSLDDVEMMTRETQVDGVMVSRGALGNPWIFSSIKNQSKEPVSLEHWHQAVATHLDRQEAAYGHLSSPMGIVMMRKHLLWYGKGWPHSKSFRERMGRIDSWDEARGLLDEFSEALIKEDVLYRTEKDLAPEGRFFWDPKFEMDRSYDGGAE
jgi:tRNA-dihydrouridine synthase B